MTRSRIGFGTGFGRAALAPPPARPAAGVLRAAHFTNQQAFGVDFGVVQEPIDLAATLWADTQVYHPLTRVSLGAAMAADGALLSASVAPINTGLVFCVGSHPTGSALLGKDLVSGNPAALLTSGNLGGVNASHGTWLCLRSTSTTNGGAAWPNTTMLRSITNQRTLAIHCNVAAYGAYSALLGIAYRAGATWTTPFFAQCLQKHGSGANLHSIFATAGAVQQQALSSGGVTLNEHWFIVTLDGVAGEARFYVDGAIRGAAIGINSSAIEWNTNQPVVIFNRSSTSPGEGVSGLCYTAAIWNRVLSAAEVASLVGAPRQMFSVGAPAGGFNVRPALFSNTQAFADANKLTNPNTIQLTASLFAQPQHFEDATVITVGPGPGPTVGPLEPEDDSAEKFDIAVGTTPRQSWWAYGFGAGGYPVNNNIKNAFNSSAITKICEDLNAKIIRFHAPINVSDYITAYKSIWDAVKQHGIDTAFITHYLYSRAETQAASTDPRGAYTPNPVAEADALKSVIDAGIPAHAASLQNEPDTSGPNRPFGTSTFTTPILQNQLDYRNRLNAIGLSAVKSFTLEWRHPENMIPDYDQNNGLDRVGTETTDVLQGGCFHAYNKGASPQIYDQRWYQQGVGLWSTESGDNHSPRAQAIFVNSANNGCEVEITHVGFALTDVRQGLATTSGVWFDWTHGLSILSKAMVRGTRMRHCTSTDRPSDLTTASASGMIWAGSATQPRQPRQQVAVGRRTDGRWVVLAVSYAYDVDAPTNYAGGHYAAIRQQLTVKIPELAGFDRVFTGKRASMTGGVISNITINMRNGWLRFTLDPGDTIAATMNLAA